MECSDTHHVPDNTSLTRLNMRKIEPPFCLKKMLCSWPTLKITLLVLLHADVQVDHDGDERREELERRAALRAGQVVEEDQDERLQLLQHDDGVLLEDLLRRHRRR